MKKYKITLILILITTTASIAQFNELTNDEFY